MIFPTNIVNFNTKNFVKPPGPNGVITVHAPNLVEAVLNNDPVLAMRDTGSAALRHHTNVSAVTSMNVTSLARGLSGPFVLKSAEADTRPDHVTVIKEVAKGWAAHSKLADATQINVVRISSIITNYQFCFS